MRDELLGNRKRTAGIPTSYIRFLPSVAEMHHADNWSVTFLGAADARAGRGIHRDYDLWDISGQWSYERGRAWAALTPRHIQLRRAGKITSEALAWFKSCGDDII